MRRWVAGNTRANKIGFLLRELDRATTRRWCNAGAVWRITHRTWLFPALALLDVYEHIPPQSFQLPKSSDGKIARITHQVAAHTVQQVVTQTATKMKTYVW